jgi:hypothetical protein
MLTKGSIEQNTHVVAPSITVRPEFNTLTRTTDPTQPLTCIVIVELPGKRPQSATPRPAPPESYSRQAGTLRIDANGICSNTASPCPDQYHHQTYAGGGPPARALSPARSDAALLAP